MDAKIILAMIAGAYFLMPNKAKAAASPEVALPSNSQSSEQALYASLTPGSVPDVHELTPPSVVSPVDPVKPSPPGEVVHDIIKALPGATPVEAWSCPDGQVPNPAWQRQRDIAARGGIVPAIAYPRCIDSYQKALDANDVAPPLRVSPITGIGIPKVCKRVIGADGLVHEEQCAW